MSRYDGTPDDEPIDVAAVGSDDVRVESLRRSLSPGAAVVRDDDDDESDPAFVLLRVLQRDVAADLPAAPDLQTAGMTALAPRQRRFGRTATIAAVTAGVLSIGGVAAAAGGSPLAGVRDAVTSVVNAITPDSPVGPVVTKPGRSPSTDARPSPEPSPAAAGDRAARRSVSATTQVTANLDRAARFLDQGRYAAAAAQLDAADRTLSLVLDPVARTALSTRLNALRTRLAGLRPEASHRAGRSDEGSAGADGSGKGEGDRRGETTSGKSERATSDQPDEGASSPPEHDRRAEPSPEPRGRASEAPIPDGSRHAATVTPSQADEDPSDAQG